MISSIRTYDWSVSLNLNKPKLAKYFLKCLMAIQAEPKSGLLVFDWLTYLDIFTSLPCSASCYNQKHDRIWEEFSDTDSTDHCTRKSFIQYDIPSTAAPCVQ